MSCSSNKAAGHLLCVKSRKGQSAKARGHDLINHPHYLQQPSYPRIDFKTRDQSKRSSEASLTCVKSDQVQFLMEPQGLRFSFTVDALRG